MYCIKRQNDGSTEMYKARLVAKDFHHQEEGVDFHGTFNPVIKPSIIRLDLSDTVSKGWTLK